jgi:hypothetical protein
MIDMVGTVMGWLMAVLGPFKDSAVRPSQPTEPAATGVDAR